MKEISNSNAFKIFHISIFAIVFFAITFLSCKKKQENIEPDPSDNLAIDSIVATKTNIITWEEIFITSYTRGKNITLKWSANHGSMLSTDSSTVKYWACPSCIGQNTIECKASNEYGSISKTITININP